MSCAPTLPQNDGPADQVERAAQLFLVQQIYAYNPSSGLPMPMAVERAALLQAAEILDWVEGWLGVQVSIFADIEVWKLETWNSVISKLDDYKKIFTLFAVPDIAQNQTWQDDGVFGSQRLAGLNPLAVSLVTEEGEGVNWGALSQKLSPAILGAQYDGQALTDIMQDGRLYVTDYVSLQGVVPEGQFQMAPVALYVKPRDFPGLMPLAIQLTQNPGDDYAYLAPQGPQNEVDYRWLMAKSYLQCADLSQNQIINHLALTHLIEEAFALATHRHLAWQHPLFRLLDKHLTALMVINQLGMITLVNPGGLVDKVLDVRLAGAMKLIETAYASWTFDDMGLPAQLKGRGVSDTGQLPYYPYRDDGLLIWNRLGQYVDEYLGLYYKSDGDVTGDYELQNWAQQLSGASDSGAGKVPGFPNQITTRAQLSDIIQRIIWTAGPQHAAVNFPQTEFTNFIPNAPGAITAEPPQGVVDESALVGLLPGKDATAAQFQTTYALAYYHYDQLLDYHLCAEDGSEQLVRKYQQLLVATDRAVIVERNQQRAAQPGLLAYPYFLPENIPNSTSV
ncbi:MAG TPA: lipoxygenase family protein [Pyrinomonadaceae bacterium]|nr:lipoxygenase family protein [Pyrinomonadaceae bacterium]